MSDTIHKEHGNFEELLDEYEERGAEWTGKTTSSCYRVDFKDDYFPAARTLGSLALDYGFIISAVNPENELAEEDSTAVFFEKFSLEKGTKTVEVEKDVTIVHENGKKHTIYE